MADNNAFFANTYFTQAEKDSAAGLSSALERYQKAAARFKAAAQSDPANRDHYLAMAAECERKASSSSNNNKPASTANRPNNSSDNTKITTNNGSNNSDKEENKEPIRHASLNDENLCYVFGKGDEAIDVRPYLVTESNKPVTFEDVKGMKDEKDTIRNEFFISDEDRAFNESIGKQNKNFILLYGLPGTGKTFFAKAVSYEMGKYFHGDIPFFSVPCTQLKDMYVGQAEHKIQALFDFFKQFDRCVVFMDEFEALALSRQKATNESTGSVVTTLLTNLDGFNSNDGLLLIAATNTPYDIDGAILSRANLTVEIPLPNQEVRFGTLKAKLGDLVDSSVNLTELAYRFKGYSNRDISNFINLAKDVYSQDHREHGQGLSKEHFKMNIGHINRAFAKTTSSIKLDEVAKLNEYKLSKNIPLKDIDDDTQEYAFEQPAEPKNNASVVKKNDVNKPVSKVEANEGKIASQEQTVVTNSHQDYSGYAVPYKEIFKVGTAHYDPNPAWLDEKQEIINTTLQNFDIEGEVVSRTKGPSFTLYEIALKPGVSVKKVTQHKDDIARALAASAIRIMAPIPGKTTVGIEAPNDVREMVAFGDILSDEFVHDGKPLNVAMGKNLDNTPVYQNIVDMPHALIAGSTGSGKSVSINTMICSMITKNSPESLKMILVDPKQVEFFPYGNIPHLLCPIIEDPNLVLKALRWAEDEMEKRYRILRENMVRNINDYNKKRANNPNLVSLPFVVIIIDEFNDLIMQCGAAVNDSIVRLTQKARACGIHVILSTQRPTADIINGTIKANVPCRISFRVATGIDSKVILDEPGAEDLLGKGDMLLKNNSIPVRAQGAYVSDEEIVSLCEYLRNNYKPDYVFDLNDK